MSNKHVSHKHGGKSNPKIRPKSTQGTRRNKALCRERKQVLWKEVMAKKASALAEIEPSA
ncbi:hypothetical protein HZA39_04445 [Candidatus Peregrinibacteria bacterium]|nr:hypothetical protein [Candidatus Peregrinibacteria bacterium]